jgi:hypothetical protein
MELPPPCVIPFESADLELASPRVVADRLRVSYAFVQLCIDVGCPTRRGRLSAAEVIHWLFENYERVREVAGLSPMGSIEGVSPRAKSRLQMANAVITLVEYGQSRASDAAQKTELEEVKRTVEWALERGTRP